jgi:hypothetical protein
LEITIIQLEIIVESNQEAKLLIAGRKGLKAGTGLKTGEISVSFDVTEIEQD